MPLHADFENKYLVCDVSSYRLNSALQNYTGLHCRSFITNPTLKVGLCAIVISKYWHEAVENFCNGLHDENCSFVKHWKPIHQFKWVWQKSIEGFFVWIFPHRHCSCPGSGSAPWRHPRRHHLHHLQWEQIPFLQHQLKYRSDRNFWQDFDKMHTKNNQKDVKQYFILTMAVSWPTSMHYWCFHRWNLGTELKWPGFWGHSKTPPSGEGWNYILKLLHGCQPDSSGCQRQPPPIPAAELCGLYAWSTGLWFSNPSGKGSSTCLYF